jgi:hypothetical protein
MGTEERDAVLAEVGEHVRVLQQRSDDGDTVDTILDDLARYAAQFVPGAQYAGITIVGRTGIIETIAPTHHYVVELDDLQRRHEQGPCLQEDNLDAVLRIDDLGAERRWPAFRQDAVKLTPIRSVLSFRLFKARRHSGALNVYADKVQAFTTDSVDVGMVFASHTGLVWNLIRRSESFEIALSSRDIIGQAKGIAMERYNLDAEQAFDLLKKLSQNSNTPVAEIAKRMVEIDHPSRLAAGSPPTPPKSEADSRPEPLIERPRRGPV